MSKLFKNNWVRTVAIALGIALPAVALAAAFNTAPNDLSTVAVQNATLNPNSNLGWGPSTTAVGGQMVTVEIYYHNSGSDPAQNTILHMNVPAAPAPSMTVNGTVSASNAPTSSGTGVINFIDGQPHTLTFSGTMRWYPDQNSLHNNTPRPLPNGQTGMELFGPGLNVGTVPTDNPNAAPGQAWEFSQGTLDVDFIVSNSIVPPQAQLSATTQPATSISTNSATLNGSVTGTNVTNVTSWFEYGSTPSLGQTTAPQFSQGQTSASIFNLLPNTTYYYRTDARSNETGQVPGGILQFQTLGNPAVCLAQPTTNQPTDITQTSANFSGSFGPNPSGPYQTWFEYGTTQSFGQQTQPTSGSTQFFGSVFNLTQGTTYFVRAVVRSSDPACPQGPIPGNTLQFQTVAVQQASLSATTLPATNVTQNSALLNGTVFGTNVTNVTRWFMWGPNASLTNSTQPQFGQGNFSDAINGLTPGATYFFQAFARSNETGLVQGGILQFTTPGVQAVCPASVNTNQPTGITQTSANFSASVVPILSGSYTDWFEVSTNPSFSTISAQTPPQIGSGASFSGFTANLQQGTIYYVRGNVRSLDAACLQGTIFGNAVQFQTTQIIQQQAMLSVTTQGASSLSQNSADVNGSVVGTNTTNVTEWFEYGTTVALGQQTSPQYSGNGNYNAYVYSLQPATTYYYRAAARANETGTVYGSILTFQTPGAVYTNYYNYNNYQTATLSATTNNATNMSMNGATLNGSIVANGANNVTRWFEWGTTYALGQRTSPQYQSYNSGSYSDVVYGLQPHTLYYFRAAATSNETGVVYGSVVPFSTPGPLVQQNFVQQQIITPQVFTNPATNVTSSSGRLNANAILNFIQSKGWFEWGTTLALGQTTAPLDLGATGANSYFTVISGLTPQTTYYFRAVTQNIQGQIAQGQLLNFTTPRAVAVYVPPATPVVYTATKPTVTVTAATYTPSKAKEVITKTVDDLSFPCGTKIYVCAREGHTLQYTITAMNPSYSATASAVITDTLAPFLDFKSASEDGTFDPATRLVQWSRLLGPREEHTFMIQVFARNIADNIVVTNNAQITEGGKTYQSNDTQVCITIAPIRLEVTADKANVSLGDTITYAVHYSNVDGAPVQNLALRMSVPQGTTLAGSNQPNLQAQGGIVMIPVGGLNPKQDGIATLTLKVDTKANADEPIVFATTASFQDTQGVPQQEVTSYVNTPISKTGSTPINSANVATAATSTGGFFPGSLLGWLAILLILLIATLVVMRIWSDYKAKSHPPETV